MMPAPLSSLKLVRIGKALPSAELAGFGERILEAFHQVLEDLQVVQYDPPILDRIEASLLTLALEEEVGGHILGITEVDLLESAGDDFHNYIFGGKDNRNAVAVVSTRRLARRNGDLSIERILKVSLHELGHNFGLGHHYSFEATADGSYCPMSKGSYNGYGERGYVKAVIDGRGFRFCARCREWLDRMRSRAQSSPG